MQLRLCKGISYAAVAAHADKSGRRKLAAMLIEHEPRSSKQVTFHLFYYHYYSKILKSPVDSICRFTWGKRLLLQEFLSKFNSFNLSTSGSSIVKHRRGRYSIDEGHWKWRHRLYLSCFVSYLAEGIILLSSVLTLNGPFI